MIRFERRGRFPTDPGEGMKVGPWFDVFDGDTYLGGADSRPTGDRLIWFGRPGFEDRHLPDVGPFDTRMTAALALRRQKEAVDTAVKRRR